MLKALQRRPLLVGTGQVLVAAVRYLTVMLVFIRAARAAREGRALKRHG